MKMTMLATALGLALMPLTFAAQTPAKPATGSLPNTTASSTSTSKPSVKKHKKHNAKTPVAKTPATTAPAAVTPAPKK